MKENEFDASLIFQMSEELISWAKSIDVEELIDQLAAGPLGETAVDQTKHLCALALQGKVLELYEYEQQLETWKKPMLLPFIDKKILSTLQAIAATK